MHMVHNEKDANQISRDNLTAVQRPWVGISDVVVGNPLKFSTPPIPNAPIQMDLAVAFMLRNVGLSAATKIDHMLEVVPVDKVGWPPKTLPPCALAVDEKTPKTFLMPQDKVPLTVIATINPTQWGTIDTIQQIWIQTCLTYQDAAGHFYRSKIIYNSVSRDDSPAIVAVPGRSLKYKAISGWNLWSSEVDEVKP